MGVILDDFDSVYSLCYQYLTKEQMYAIDIHTDIVGNTLEAINDCIYAMFGYRTFKQFYYSELV